MKVNSYQCMEKAEAKNDMTLVVKGSRIKRNQESKKESDILEREILN